MPTLQSGEHLIQTFSGRIHRIFIGTAILLVLLIILYICTAPNLGDVVLSSLVILGIAAFFGILGYITQYNTYHITNKRFIVHTFLHIKEYHYQDIKKVRTNIFTTGIVLIFHNWFDNGVLAKTKTFSPIVHSRQLVEVLSEQLEAYQRNVAMWLETPDPVRLQSGETILYTFMGDTHRTIVGIGIFGIICMLSLFFLVLFGNPELFSEIIRHGKTHVSSYDQRIVFVWYVFISILLILYGLLSKNNRYYVTNKRFIAKTVLTTRQYPYKNIKKVRLLRSKKGIRLIFTRWIGRKFPVKSFSFSPIQNAEMLFEKLSQKI